MKTRPLLTLAFLIFLFMLVNPCTNLRVHSPIDIPINEGTEEAREKFQEAYNATVEAERNGAEVSEAAKKLNNALDYIFQAENHTAHGDMEQAFFWTQASIQLSEEIVGLTQELKQQAETLRYTRLIVYSAISVVLIIFVIYAFFIGRRMWKRHQQKKLMDMRIKGTLGSK
jgi:ABC-type transport system involved in cytochrome bd biosynthesis fused ATPase/permease subunit